MRLDNKQTSSITLLTLPENVVQVGFKDRRWVGKGVGGVVQLSLSSSVSSFNVVAYHRQFLCVFQSACRCVSKTNTPHSSTCCQSVAVKITCLKSLSHLVTSNCCRVCICVCVFLLFTANHRNGKPVSTVTLFSCSGVNVFFFCMTRNGRGGEGKRKGRVVIVLCLSLRRTYYNPVASWVWAASCPPHPPTTPICKTSRQPISQKTQRRRSFCFGF